MIKAIVLDCFGVLYVPRDDYFYQTVMNNPKVHHDEIRDLVKQNEYGYIDDKTLFEGITARDYPVIQGVTVVTAMAFVFINLVVDILYAYLDPRVRLE